MLKKILLKISRIIGWVVFSVIVLLITAVLLVRIPSIQNKIAQKAITYLEEKIKTNVELERIVIDFPKKIVIEGLYIEDQHKDTLLYAGRLAVDASMMKLLSNEIELTQIELSNTTANINRTLPDSAFNFDYIIRAFAGTDTTVTLPVDTTAVPWTFSLGDVELEQVKFSYTDNVDSILVAGNIGAMDVDTDEFDPLALSVALNELDITNTSIRYANFAAKESGEPFDPNYLNLSQIDLSATDIRYDSTNNMKIDLETLSFMEKKGLALEKLSGVIRFNSGVAELSSVELLFGKSHLFIDGRATYKSASDLASIAGDISVTKSQIAVSDVLLFQPTLLDSLPLTVPADAMIYIDAKAHGDMAEAVLETFELRTLDSTFLSMAGTARGLHDLNTSKLDASLKEFYTTMADAKLIVADTLFPDSLDLPSWVSVKGKVHGSVLKPVIASTVTTDKGVITADGRLNITTDIPAYQAKITGRGIKAGKLAGQPALGDINFDLAVDGKGITTKDIHTRVDLAIKDIAYNEYVFRDFTVNGTLDKFLFSGKAALNDENLRFELDADLDYNGDVPVYKAQFDLKNIDFLALKMTDKPLKARLTVDVDLITNDFKIMNGRLDIRKVAVFNGEKLYAVDSMLFASLDQEGRCKMSVRSDILTGDFEGSFNIFSVSEALQHHFERYFSDGKNEAKPVGPPQFFTFDLKIKNTDLITEVLVPGLDPFTPGVIRGEFDSRKNKLDLEFRMPKLKYNGTAVDSVIMLVDSDNDELRYFTKVKHLVADTIVVHEVNLGGTISNDSIRTTLNVLDSLEEKKYSIGTSLARDGNLMRVSLYRGLMLNYAAWEVPAGNYLAFGKGVVAANQFQIIKQKQKVSMIGDTRNDPAITIRFEELELGNLTHIISGVVPASGELNGDFKFTTAASGEFSSKLTVTGLTLLQIPLGDLTLALEHSGTQYNVDMGLRGNRTRLGTTGTYGGPKGNEVLDLVATITELNMEAVQAFSMGQIISATGLVKGKIEVKGKPSHPDFAGDLTFNEVSVVPTYLNSTFELKNETIAIRNDNISLNNFIIRDGDGNQAQLKGNIKIANYRNPEFDLSLNTKSFQVLNTGARDNELFYGKVKINSTARISGSARQPKVDLKLSFTDDTNFTYVVPTSEKGVLEAKGIVNFVDKDAIKDPFLANIKASDSINSAFAGIEVSAVIEIQDEEILSIVIDPITGDKLTVQGSSTLTFDMTSSGNMNLSGRYEITKGSYNISFYNLVKRKFDIEKGSTITWAGDPLNATMDIHASNLVETSPLDLLSSQVNGSDPSAANNFNQRLPFLVFLNIKGQLLSPQISFRLDMPADKRNAFGGVLYSKLLDINSRESDLNKQVFALLILKRFVADNPFESSTGGVSNTARTSVSRVLSEQLNRLSQNVKGVQLSVDIKSYEMASAEGGAQGRTRAQLGVSKTLFGDRLVVKLSGNVDIEGEDAGSGNVSDYIGDLALEYKMTQDGRFRVTGFRNSNYDMIDGELTETGAGVIYIKDYNTLRELFKANEKETP
ncbi:MAG TPA: translocation/assembly module TamB domain-containing protein [Cyclobacteriaceae bacterium]|nr:translocation/assembly module TamB domain-containing protein [Cyclobacteriaceae bacterium]